ncbi:MAG: hypothetical protein ACSLEW_09080 [Nocardioides sp.]
MMVALACPSARWTVNVAASRDQATGVEVAQVVEGELVDADPGPDLASLVAVAVE